MTAGTESERTLVREPPEPTSRLKGLDTETFDVLVVGAGVNGAAVFRELARRGYRVLLVDRGDFASGTSQASGMLVWGGLLYLRSLELRTVRALSRARDELLVAEPDDVTRAPFRYFPLRRGLGARPAWLVRLALELYWWLGGRRRRRPARERSVPTFLRGERFEGALTYEEGALVRSDARLVLGWILGVEDEHRIALNHVEAAHFRRESGHWRVRLQDRTSSSSCTVRARVVINTAGVFADELARRIGVRTRHRHVLSKGVYLGLERPPELREFLAFELGRHGDTQTFTPWGPIALWGPTETPIETLEGAFEPDVEDVRSLLREARKNLTCDVDVEHIVSLRAGVRPLAVASSYSRTVYPLNLSRRHVCDVDVERAALTVFGGKITGAPGVAQEIADVLGRTLAPRFGAVQEASRAEGPANFRFSGLEAPLIDPAASARREHCQTLVDYIRRRTNLAQWTRRHGLGRDDEYALELRCIAAAIEGDSHADRAVNTVHALARRQDELLRRV